MVTAAERAARAYADRAGAVMPGGVNSPVRAWNAVGGDPIPIVSGHGPMLVDAAGREHVDLVCSWGAAVLGHAHPAVVEAVARAAGRGLSFGAATEAEAELAEAIRDRYEPARMVRLVTSGTEAVMTALRLARAATGRDLVVKFAGCYHGHSDSMLVAAGSGLATAGMPDSAGVTAAVASQTIVLPYNDANALEAAFAEHGHSIAAVITEAAPANMGVVAPEPGFNALIGRLARRHGAVFVLDEVLTGFRAGPAGWWGLERDEALAAGHEPWMPDLVTLGKVVGGGMPLAAVAGRAELMTLLAPVGPVYQAGTLAGSPVAVAAGLATLAALDAEAYGRLGVAADRLAAALSGLPGTAVGRAGTLASPFPGLAAAPRDYSQAAEADRAAYASLFHHLLDLGVYAPPSMFESWFVSTAHGEAQISQVERALASWGGPEAPA